MRVWCDAFAMLDPARRTISDNFTAIRLIAAMGVVLSHSYPLIGEPHEPIVMNRTVGNFAVHCFFVISGYLIAGSWARSPGWKFVCRRAARLAPALIVSHAFALIAAGAFNNYIGQPVPWIYHGSLWTINWEVLMYIGVCLFGIMGLLRPAVLGSLYAVGLLLICINMGSTSTGSTVIAPLVLLFVCGALLQINKEIDIARLGPYAIAILFVLFAPGISDSALDLLRQWPFGFAWDIDAGGVRYLVYLLALPIAVIYICAFAPFALRIRNDYSYGVLADPADLRPLFYGMGPAAGTPVALCRVRNPVASGRHPALALCRNADQ
jgi:peptidoglycan/LPS O-acetylase OafA/YrhL